MCYHWIDISRQETVDALLVSIESGRPTRQGTHQSKSFLELPKSQGEIRADLKERMHVRMSGGGGLLRSLLTLRQAPFGRLR